MTYVELKLDNKLIDLVGQEGAENAINLIFALSLMGDIPTNKARMSDNAQLQSASNAVIILISQIRLFLSRQAIS